MKSKKFSFLVPCYNCEKIIFNNGLKLLKKIQRNKINFEIFFINDGSNDGSLAELNKLKKLNNKIKIINFRVNEGKSSVLKKSIKKTSGKIIILYDCDLPYLNYFDRVVKLLNKGNKFVTIDRRAIESKFDYTQSNLYQIFRYLVSKLVNIIISFTILKNFNGDTQSGLKGFQLIKNFKNQNFLSKKFFLDAEIISFFEKKNIKITSVPIKYKISKTSSIKIFSINNFFYFYELFKIILKDLIKFR